MGFEKLSGNEGGERAELNSVLGNFKVTMKSRRKRMIALLRNNEKKEEIL